MKNLITLFALFLTLGLEAQREVITDSTWITNQSGIFYANRYKEFMNGEVILSKERLGDTAQVAESYHHTFLAETSTWANDVEVTSDYPRKIKELIRQDAAILAELGKSPLKTILEEEDSRLVDSTWKVRINGNSKQFKFSLSQAGALRYKVDTFTTRSATVLGDVIRLANWLNSGQALDLFKFDSGRWFNATRQVQVYLVSAGPQLRTADMPELFTDVMPPAGAILYEGGYVKRGETWLKYNATAKGWKSVKAPVAPKIAR